MKKPKPKRREGAGESPALPQDIRDLLEWAEDGPDLAPALQKERDEDLATDESDLHGEMMNIPNLLYKWRKRKQKAYFRQRAMRLYREAVVAKMATDLRQRAEVLGEKVSERGIAERIELDPRVVAARKVRIEAEYLYNELLNVVLSLESKEKMLVMIGADKRKDRSL